MSIPTRLQRYCEPVSLATAAFIDYFVLLLFVVVLVVDTVVVIIVAIVEIKLFSG